MAEARPSKKSGHAYGRRNQAISNTAEEGDLCLYTGHSLGRFSSHSMRYDSHQACIRCVRNAREGMLSLDINRLLKKNRIKALKFWSKVDIGSPEECWNWHGTINSRTQQPQFAWRRHGIATSTQHHPQRVAMWFSWGDLGFTGVKTTCGNKYCCNPFHLIPQNVGVFVDHESYLESHEIACEIQTLKQQVQEYMIEEAMKEQHKIDASEEIDARSQLILNPETGFGAKFEAVMTDLLNGKHITQTDSDTEGLYRDITDNDPESTEEF
jgi:hypothetical protein